MKPESNSGEPALALPLREDAGALTVVGLGGNAGSITALQVFFESVSSTSGSAYVVLHLSPQHESHLAEVLARSSSIPVQQITQSVKIQPNQVYVIPPGKDLTMQDGTLELREPDQAQGPRVGIDTFFRNLAAAYGTQSVAVVLSGTGADGTLGIRQIKESGGLVVAQTPAEAEFDAMPRSAIATGMVDYVLPVASMGAQIADYWATSRAMRIPEEAALHDIFTHVRIHTGHDFADYKRATVLRRVGRRMQVNGQQSLPAYRDFLHAHPAEAEALIGAPEAWATLERDVIPELFAHRVGDDTEVRADTLWSSESLRVRPAVPDSDIVPPALFSARPGGGGGSNVSRDILSRYGPPVAVVNEEYMLVDLSGNVSDFLVLPEGEPTYNLLELIHPSLRPDLHGALSGAAQEGVEQTRVVRDPPHEDQASPFLSHTPALRISVRPVPASATPDAPTYFMVQLERLSEGLLTTLRPFLSEGLPDARSVAWEDSPDAAIQRDLRLASEQDDAITEELKARGEESTATDSDLSNFLGANEIGEFITDITEQKQAAAAVRESEAKYRTLFHSMEKGFCIIEMVHDPTGVSVDYRFVEVNRVFERQTGLEDVVGKLGSQLTPGTEIYWIEMYDKVARTGEPMRFENYHEATARWYQVSASRVGDDDSRQVAIIFDDITARRNATETQAFLLKLSDTLRSLSDPVGVQEAAMHVLGEHLGVNRAFYGEMQKDNDTLVIGPGYASELPPLTGRVKFSDFESDMLLTYRAGETVVLNDIPSDTRFSAKAKAEFAALSVQAAVGVALVKNERVRAILSIHQSISRQWTQHEIALLKETAERTWAAVERARAEEATEAAMKTVERANEALEIRVAERTQELSEMSALRQELLRKLVTAQEEERGRISRDLHDDTGQQMATLLLSLDHLKSHPALTDASDAQLALEQSQRLAQDVARKLHRISFTLRPTDLDDLGLIGALRNYAEVWTGWSRVPAQVVGTGFESDGRLPSELETTIYRVAQEALTNILKYAAGPDVPESDRATRVSVLVQRRSESVMAVIEDNGPGFDVEAALNRPQGERRLGIFGMQERARLVGGTLDVESALGEGTTVYLRLPLLPA